jgi:hypothetical protein
MAERPTQYGPIDPAERPHEQGLGLPHVFRQQQRCKGRRDRERRDQRSEQRVAISLRHRGEDLALDSLHREQRDEGCNRDCGRKEDRFVDLQGAEIDEAQPI